jgi:hypothetical protein
MAFIVDWSENSVTREGEWVGEVPPFPCMMSDADGALIDAPVTRADLDTGEYWVLLEPKVLPFSDELNLERREAKPPLRVFDLRSGETYYRGRA